MAQNTQYHIRSATTLLSIIDQQVEQPRQSSDLRSVRFLDRIALLFVTRLKEDDSAVSAVLTVSDSILVGCTDSSDDNDEDAEDVIADTGDITCDTADYLLVTKNSPRGRVKKSAATGRRLDRAGSSERNGGQPEDIEVVVEDTSAASLPCMYSYLKALISLKLWLTCSGLR